MSDDLEFRLREDRSLRDAARALVTADISHLRADLTARSFGERISDRIGDGATDLFDEAVDLADDNRGVLFTLIAAVALWFARNPIMSLFALEDDESDDEEDDGSGENSQDEE